MDHPQKATSGGSGRRRSTVGNRLGGGNISNKNQQQSQNIEEVVPQLEQVTQMLKDCLLNQQRGREEQNIKGGGNGQYRAKQQTEWCQEVHFEPPWESKIGQMQQVVRAIQRHTNTMLENRGSVIIRCYPYKSATYMHLVYDLIYNTLGNGQPFGPSVQSTPSEIRPILLHYDDNGMPNPVQQQAAPYSTMPQINQQPNWTDIVLVRVRFAQKEPAIYFMQNFNRNVGYVFDRRQFRSPFAHPDLTQPERILRHQLQQYCMDKNGSYNRRATRNRSNFYSQHYYQQQQSNNEARYYHDGLQVFKEFTNGMSEPVQFQNYTELQCLHVVVKSMRKYATMYRQKETSVIIQNIEMEELSEADTERITALVYLVVTTDSYRQRCMEIRERFKRRSTQNVQANNPTMRGGQNRNGSNSSGNNNNDFLPSRIERIPRRKWTTTQTQQTVVPPNSGGGGDTTGKSTLPPKKETEAENKQKQREEGETLGATEPGERPPLVRIQFQNRESATAFCQLFKISQRHQKIVEEEYAGRNEGDDEGEQGHSTTDSYSDLSDLEEVFGSENDDKNGDEEAKEKEEEGHEEEGTSGNAKNNNNKEDEKKKDKNNGKKHRRRHQPKMRLYFPNAFVHRDLTPPELALGYNLRQYCREKNAEIQDDGVFASNIASGSGGPANEGLKQQQRRYFTRVGRIFERQEPNDGEQQQQRAA